MCGAWTRILTLCSSSRPELKDSGIATEYVFMIYADGDDLWVGGIEGDLTRYDRKTGKYRYYPVECAYDMIRAKDGALYVISLRRCGRDGSGALTILNGRAC